MNTLLKRALQTAVCAAGLWAIGNAVASAETVPPPAIQIPITAPVAVTGNSVAVFDGLPPVADVNLNVAAAANAAVNVANVVSVPIAIPVDVSGNPITVGASEPTPAAAAPAASPAGTTSGSGTSGSLVNAPVSLPVLVCGNAIGVLADPAATCGAAAAPAAPAAGSGPTTPTATLLSAPVNLPVLVCGNGVGVLGDATATCGNTSGASGTDPTDPTDPTVGVPVTVPVTVCGTGIGVLGDASANCGGQPNDPSVPVQPTTLTQSPTAIDVLRSTINGGSGQAPSALRTTSLPFTGVDSLGLIALAIALLVGGVMLASFGAMRRRPAVAERRG